MALIPSFQVSQTPLNPANVTVVDNSTGSDVLLNSRRIYFTDAEGNVVVPIGTTTTYVLFPYGSNTIDIDLLSEDKALDVRVAWLDVSDGQLYTLTQSYALVQFTKSFLYYLVQVQGLTPSIVNDNNYESNIALLWTSIRGAINAIEVANDIAAAQNCLDRCTYFSLNQSKFF